MYSNRRPFLEINLCDKFAFSRSSPAGALPSFSQLPNAAAEPERKHWDLEYTFSGGPFRLRQIRPEHAVAMGDVYTAAQRARAPLPPPPTKSVAPSGMIRRIWIWGELRTET